MKIKDSGGLAFISLHSLSFIPLFGARSSRRRWAVSIHLLRRWQGLCPGGTHPASARLSMVLKTKTDPDEGGRDRGRGWGWGHWGDIWRSASVLSLKKGNTALVRCWEVRKREAVCKSPTVKSKLKKNPLCLIALVKVIVTVLRSWCSR